MNFRILIADDSLKVFNEQPEQIFPKEAVPPRHFQSSSIIANLLPNYAENQCSWPISSHLGQQDKNLICTSSPPHLTVYSCGICCRPGCYTACTQIYMMARYDSIPHIDAVRGRIASCYGHNYGEFEGSQPRLRFGLVEPDQVEEVVVQRLAEPWSGACLHSTVDIGRLSIVHHICSKIEHRKGNYSKVSRKIRFASSLIAHVIWLQPTSSSTTLLHEWHRCHPFSAAAVSSNCKFVSAGQSPWCSAPLHIVQVSEPQSGHVPMSPLIFSVLRKTDCKGFGSVSCSIHYQL
jgi:hypothetical protein